MSKNIKSVKVIKITIAHPLNIQAFYRYRPKQQEGQVILCTRYIEQPRKSGGNFSELTEIQTNKTLALQFSHIPKLTTYTMYFIYK